MLRGTGAGQVNLSAKLEAVSGVGSGSGLLENTGASTVAIRTIGTGAGTSIPSTTDADARFIRWFEAMPAGGVGANGDYGFLYVANGYPGVLIKKTAGTWATVDASLTFANIQAIASPAAGMTALCSSIALGGTIGTRFVNTPFRYDGTYWKPLGPLTLDGLTAVTTLTTAAAAGQALRTMAPPAGLIHPGTYLRFDLMMRTDTPGSGDTARLKITDNGAAGTVLTTTNSDNMGGWHGECALWSVTANRLTGIGAAAASMDSPQTSTSSTDTETAANYDGSRTLDIVVDPVTGGTAKQWQLTLCSIVMFPLQTA